jgi:endo-1,4-beta-xylanase
MKIILKSLAIFVIMTTLGCGSSNKTNPTNYGLKDYFNDDFLMGVAINSNQIEQKDVLGNPLIIKEFNSLTPENIMKCEVIHPEWDRYDFTLADKMVDYAMKNNLKVVGHNFIWHSQLAPFVQQIKSKDSLKTFMENHIMTIGQRYDKKVHGWDVINEAIEEDGTLRKSIFLNLLGEDYLVESFRLAQKATPNAELYYNDYNIERAPKRQGAIDIIKKIKAAGVRIDGIGIQGHWNINNLPLKDIEESIIEFSKLGVKVHFTEIDLSVIPNPYDMDGADVNRTFENTPAMNPYPKELPDAIHRELAQKYDQLFRLFLKHNDKIGRVTFWGLSDGNSWLNDWPIKGRTNYPLLFDKDYKPKAAYHVVMATKGVSKN